MECVAYIRVSTDKQAEEGNGLDSQKRDIENYCRKNELVIKEWYIDDGYTGANTDRPALQRLKNDCLSKRVKCIVAFKLDRLSRSMIDGLYLIERVFQPNGIEFRCVHDSVSYDSPMEQAYTQMMAVFAQLDKNTMMLRMRGGMLERVKQGHWMGGGNLPYCYTYNKELGILEPIPERKEQANKALDLFLQGYSDVKIKDILGFSTEGSVRSLLTGVVNIGMIPYKGEVYQGLHEPIFDKEKFELAQNMRRSRSRARSMGQNFETHMLTGLCYCGVCGCKMRYQNYSYCNKLKIWCCSHDKQLKYLPNHNPNCDSKFFWANDIENEVSNKIIKISLNISKQKPKRNQSKLEIMEKQLESEKQKLKRLYNLYAEGNDTVIGMIKSQENKIGKMENNIASEMKERNQEPKKDFVYDKIKTVADIWNQADNRQKNTILKSIISKIVIVNDKVEIQLKNLY